MGHHVLGASLFAKISKGRYNGKCVPMQQKDDNLNLNYNILG